MKKIKETNKKLSKNFDPTNKELCDTWLWRGLFIGALGTILFTLLLINEYDSRNFLTRKDVNEINSYANYISENYIDQVDKEQMKADMIKGMFSNLDLYSDFYGEKELAENKEHEGDYVGIGVLTSVRSYDGKVVILNIMPNSPAEEVGLLPNDIIERVDGQLLVKKKAEEVSDMIRGKEGTTVKLEIKRNDETLEFEVVRKPITATNIFIDQITEETDLIRLYSFNEETAEGFANYIDKTEKSKLIIDLRNNGGGDVDTMMKMLDHIPTVKDGELVFYSVDSSGNRKDYNISKQNNGDKNQDLQIAILMNENTASCSEIFTAYLKENGYATTIGSTTFGKGVIQDYIELNNGCAVKLTTAEYFTSKGNKVNEVGIEPDVENYDDDKMIELALLSLKDKDAETYISESKPGENAEAEEKPYELADDEVLFNDIEFPNIGDKYADLSIDSIGVNTEITMGSLQEIVDANDVVISGRGGFCGSNQPIVLAGHNNRSFSNLDKIQVGDTIKITTNYGTYIYKVLSLSQGTVNEENTNIIDDEGNKLLEFEGSKEYLYAYTCIGDTLTTKERMVVKAEKIQGTKVLY